MLTTMICFIYSSLTGSRTWLVISTLLLKLKESLRLQAVMYSAEVVLSRKQCKIETYCRPPVGSNVCATSLQQFRLLRSMKVIYLL